MMMRATGAPGRARSIEREIKVLQGIAPDALAHILREPTPQEWERMRRRACGDVPCPSSVERAVREFLTARRQELVTIATG